MSRLLEPYYAGVAVVGNHLLGNLIRDVVVVLAEDEEVWDATIS